MAKKEKKKGTKGPNKMNPTREALKPGTAAPALQAPPHTVQEAQAQPYTAQSPLASHKDLGAPSTSSHSSEGSQHLLTQIRWSKNHVTQPKGYLAPWAHNTTSNNSRDLSTTIQIRKLLAPKHHLILLGVGGRKHHPTQLRGPIAPPHTNQGAPSIPSYS